MPSYSCSDFHLENPWMLYPPLVLAIPTLVLNIILVQLVLMKKEFDHMFYGLLCVFSMSSTCKWFTSLLVSTFMKTGFACNVFYGTFLSHDHLILLLTVPNMFFYFSVHHAGILLALNRVTTAISPVSAKKYWYNNQKGIMLTTFFLICFHCIPYMFSYAYINPSTGLSESSSAKFNGSYQRGVFDVITILLLLLLLIITVYTKVFNQELAKFANERNMLHTGLVLAVFTGVTATLNLLKSFYFIGFVNEILGYARLAPVYIILAMDAVIRDFVLQYLRIRNTTSTAITIFVVGNN